MANPKLSIILSAKDEMSANIDKARKSLDAIKNSGASTRQQLRALQQNLAEMNGAGLSSTRVFTEMAQYAGQLADAIGDARQAVNAFADDQFKIKAIGEAMSLGVTSATMLASVLDLLGAKNESVTEAIKKAQLAMVALNGVQQISNLLNKDSALMLRLKQIQLKVNSALTAQDSAAITGNTVATGANTAANTLATKARQKLNTAIAVGKALMGDWTGLLLVGAAALTTYAMFSGNAADKTEDLNEATKKAREATEKYRSSFASHASDLISRYRQLQSSWSRLTTEMEKSQFLKDRASDFKALGMSVNSVTDAENYLVRNTSKVVAALEARARAMVAQQRMADTLNEYYTQRDQVMEDTKARVYKAGDVIRPLEDENMKELMMMNDGDYKIRSQYGIMNWDSSQLTLSAKTASELNLLETQKAFESRNEKLQQIEKDFTQKYETDKKRLEELTSLYSSGGLDFDAPQVDRTEPKAGKKDSSKTEIKVDVNSLKYAEDKVKELEGKRVKIPVDATEELERNRKEIERWQREVTERKMALALSVDYDDDTLKQLQEELRDLKDKRIKVNVDSPESVEVEVNSPEPIDVKVNSPEPVDIDIEQPEPINVKVNAPEPVNIDVNKPKPVDVKVNSPEPVDIDVEQPEPVDIKVNSPEPVSIDVKQPEPIDVKVNSPGSVSIDVKNPEPVDIGIIQPEPVDIKVNSPEPVSIDVKQPEPIDVKVNAPEPVKIDVKNPEPVDIGIIQPEPVDIKVNSPEPVSIDVKQPEPIDVKVNAPEPVNIDVNKPKPVDVKVNSPEPVDIDIEQPEPVDIKVNSPEPIDIDIEQPEPVDIKVNSPEPVSIDVKQPEPIDIKVNAPESVNIDVRQPKPVKVEAETGEAQRSVESILNQMEARRLIIDVESRYDDSTLKGMEEKLKALQNYRYVISPEKRETIAALDAEIKGMEKKVKETRMALKIEPEVETGSLSALEEKIKEIEDEIVRIDVKTDPSRLEDLKKRLRDLNLEKADLEKKISIEIQPSISFEPERLSPGNKEDKRRSYSNAMSQIDRIGADFGMRIIGKEEAERQIKDIISSLKELIPDLEIKVKVNDDGTIETTRSNLLALPDAMGNIGNAVNTLGSSMQNLAKDNEGLAKAAAITQAVGTLALTFAQAMKGTATPWDWIAGAVAGVATLTAVVGQLQSFESGGIVGGSSFSGDRLLVRANSGEMILNQRQQNNLFRAIDTGDMSGNSAPMTIDFRLKGEDIVGAVTNYNSKRRKQS